MREYFNQKPRHQYLHIELLRSRFQSRSHIHMRRQVTSVYFEVRTNRALFLPIYLPRLHSRLNINKKIIYDYSAVRIPSSL